MKKIIGSLLILLVLLVGSYYAMGYLTEKKVKEDLSVINQSNGISVQLKDYKRGLFTSKALFDLHIESPEKVLRSESPSPLNQPKPFVIPIPLKIYHGPIIFANNHVKFGLGQASVHVPFPSAYQQKFNDIFTADSSKPQLDLNVFLSYLGTARIDSTVPQFKLLSKQGDMTVNCKGLTAFTKIDSDLDHVKGYFALKGLDLLLDKLNIQINHAESDYQLHRTEKPELLLGDAKLFFPSFKMSEGDISVFELKDFKIKSNTDIKDSLFSLSFDSSVSAMKFRQDTYGASRLKFAVRNLDAITAAKIQNQLHLLQQSSDIQRQGTMLAIFSELPSLLDQGAMFDVNEFLLAMPAGEIKAQLNLSIPKGAMQNLLQVTQKIEGKGKIRLPATFVKQILTESFKERLMTPEAIKAESADNATKINENIQTSLKSADLYQEANTLAERQIQLLKEKTFLKEDGPFYIIDADLKNGNLILNGKPFDWSSMKLQ